MLTAIKQLSFLSSLSLLPFLRRRKSSSHGIAQRTPKHQMIVPLREQSFDLLPKSSIKNISVTVYLVYLPKNRETTALLAIHHHDFYNKSCNINMQCTLVLTCVTQFSFPATWAETFKWINFINACSTILTRFPKTIIDIYDKKSAIIAQGCLHLL